MLKFNKYEEQRFIESGAMQHYARMRERKIRAAQAQAQTQVAQQQMQQNPQKQAEPVATAV